MKTRHTLIAAVLAVILGGLAVPTLAEAPGGSQMMPNQDKGMGHTDQSSAAVVSRRHGAGDDAVCREPLGLARDRAAGRDLRHHGVDARPRPAGRRLRDGRFSQPCLRRPARLRLSVPRSALHWPAGRSTSCWCLRHSVSAWRRPSSRSLPGRGWWRGCRAPGPWIDWLRRALGSALLGTAAWLLSVLATEAGLWRARFGRYGVPLERGLRTRSPRRPPCPSFWIRPR